MSDQMAMLPSAPLPSLDPPFRGYIETTFDALLVFEAARRGMIPRVTRRLIERERGMVQSGAVFVFDEHESGIKRWTDGLIWSPSRILGNFLVYRETDKKTGNPPTPISNHPSSSSPSDLPMVMSHQLPQYGESSQMGRHTPPHPLDPPPVLGAGALHRPRSSSDGGNMDRQRERQLVGSLTNSYKFKDRGLVKKTMSVTVNGFAQHMISYYTVEDVLAGKLRTPSTIPELSALEISPEYLHKSNFRFPPMVEIGPDGIPRYRGEPEEPMSPTSPTSGLSMGSFPTSYDAPIDSYGSHPQLRLTDSSASSQSRNRSVTVPMPIPVPLSSSGGQTYFAPGSAGSGYYEAPPIMRPDSTSSSGMRPGSSSRRYEPYAPTSPRGAHLQVQSQRRPSQPIAIPSGNDGYYAHQHHTQHHHPASYDVKPDISGSSPGLFHYQPPQTAPSTFASFYPHGTHASHQQVPPHAAQPSQQYAAWQQPPPSASGRMMPREYAPPGSAGGSSGSGGSVPPVSTGSGAPLGASHSQAPGSAGLADSAWAGAPGIGGWEGQGPAYETWRT